MRTAGTALILLLLLSTMICQGQENRDQESEDDTATETFYFVIGIVFAIICFILQFRYALTEGGFIIWQIKDGIFVIFKIHLCMPLIHINHRKFSHPSRFELFIDLCTIIENYLCQIYVRCQLRCISYTNFRFFII